MEGQIQTQKYGFIENFHPKYCGPAYLLPKKMGDNFHRKMGQHKLFPIQQCLVKVFPSWGGGGGLGGSPYVLYVPPHNSCPPHKILKLSSSIFVDHDRNLLRYFFNLCMTKANLTSITSLRMQTLLS